MAMVMGDIIARIKADVSDLERGLQQAKDGTKSFEDAVSASSIASVISLTAIAKAIKEIATAIWDLSREGASFQSVQESFGEMTAGMGVDGAKVIADVKAMSHDTISELDIMQNYMKANTLIGQEALGKNGENFVKFAEIAKKASRATGQDVNYMFESIINGIGRQQPLWLDNTGIVINATEAFDAYAIQAGATTKVVTRSAGEIDKLNASIADNEAKLAVAIQRSKEFTDKTAKSTKMSNANTIAKLKGTIALEKAQVANKSYTTTVKASSEALTVEQKKQALTNAYLEKAERLYKEVKTTAGGTGTDFMRLDVTMEELRLTIGLLLTEAIQPLVKWLNEVAMFVRDTIVPWFVQHKEVVIGLAVAIGTTLISVIVALIDLMMPLITATISAIAPFVLLGAVIGLIAGLIYKAWTTNFGGIQEKTKAVLDWFKTVAMPFIVQFAKVMVLIITEMARVILNVFDWLMKNIYPIVKHIVVSNIQAFQFLANFILGFARAVLNTISVLMELLGLYLVGDMNELIARSIEVFGGLFLGIVATIEKVTSAIGDFFADITKKINDWAKSKLIAFALKELFGVEAEPVKWAGGGGGGGGGGSWGGSDVGQWLIDFSKKLSDANGKIEDFQNGLNTGLNNAVSGLNALGDSISTSTALPNFGNQIVNYGQQITGQSLPQVVQNITVYATDDVDIDKMIESLAYKYRISL